MYLVKEGKKRVGSIRFKPFPGFSGPTTSVEARLKRIETLIQQRKADEAIRTTMALIKTGLDGLRYLQTYNWFFLRTLVTAGYIGWMAFGVTSIIDQHVLRGAAKPQRTVGSSIFFSSILVALFSFLFVQSSPWTYYAYSVFPVYFWEEVFVQRSALYQGQRVLFGKISSKASRLSLGIQAVAFTALLQALVRFLQLIAAMLTDLRCGATATARFTPCAMFWPLCGLYSMALSSSSRTVLQREPGQRRVLA
jgi:phosphatidylinositol glycan class N